MRSKLIKITINFLSVLLLTLAIVSPLYFAENFAKVAGVKSQSDFLLISQVENFPNLTLFQKGDIYTLNFQKYAPNQAFLDIFILNNPSNSSKTYKIEIISGKSKVFFGQNIKGQKSQITVPQSASVPISLFAQDANEKSVEFKILTTVGNE